MARPKRPKDTNQLAKLVADIATGEREENMASEPVNEFARAGGLKGGRARAEKLTKERHVQIAKRAAASRWGNNGHD